MKKLLEILGSMTALFFAIAFFAVTMLMLAGCSGPTEAQAAFDVSEEVKAAGLDAEIRYQVAKALIEKQNP